MGRSGRIDAPEVAAFAAASAVAAPARSATTRRRATRGALRMALPTTRWSLVARTGAADRATAQRALGELCEAYWEPLHAYAQRVCPVGVDARDLVQAFCVQLLQHGGVAAADPGRGRFRHYLLGAFANFLRNQARAGRADKRGGGMPTVDLDAAADVGDRQLDPEHLFERRWAQALLDRALARLRNEHTTAPKQALLAQLEPALLGCDDAARSAEVAQALGSSEGAVRVALHRLRQRWRDLVRDEVAQTVADPAEVDDELRALRTALARSRPAGATSPDSRSPVGNEPPTHGS